MLTRPLAKKKIQLPFSNISNRVFPKKNIDRKVNTIIPAIKNKKLMNRK